MDPKEKLEQKRARQSVNEMLEAYYIYWLRHFENDSEAFLDGVVRFAQGNRDISPSTAPAA
jgi:hypothetical protein